MGSFRRFVTVLGASALMMGTLTISVAATSGTAFAASDVYKRQDQQG